MKKIFTAAILLITSMACNTNKLLPVAHIGVVSLDSYVTKNTVALPELLNCKVITNNADFYNTFSKLPATVNSAAPDFKGQTVVAVIASATSSYQALQLTKANIVGNTLHVYCSAQESSHASYSVVPAAIAAVPKAVHVTQVSFYVNDEQINIVAVPATKKATDAVTLQTPEKRPAGKKTMRNPAMI